MKYKAIYDISVMLGEEAVDYPGDTPYSRKLLKTIKDGEGYELSSLSFSAHAGTHIDAPAHFIAGGKTIDQYHIGNFILPALVVDVDDPHAVTRKAVTGVTSHPGDALLFRTNNSTSGLSCSSIFTESFVYLTPTAAGACVAKGAALVGFDYSTIEQYGSSTFKAHRTLLGAGILILEGINLNGVPAGRYTLFCMPLKMKGAEASPVRAVLAK